MKRNKIKEWDKIKLIKIVQIIIFTLYPVVPKRHSPSSQELVSIVMYGY